MFMCHYSARVESFLFTFLFLYLDGLLWYIIKQNYLGDIRHMCVFC